MIEWWQHLPAHIDPIVFTVGFFSVRWYALFWLVGFTVAFLWARRSKKLFSISLSDEALLDLFLLLFFGALIGGHLGYAWLYRPDIFLSDPLGFFLPYQGATGTWSGITGMSFHGGLIGVVAVLVFFTYRQRLPFWSLADLIALVAPLALFFGRLGNFFAHELYGRVTTVVWGMYFPGAPGAAALRHPSPLYEALGEGLLLFLCLWWLRRRQSVRGQLAAGFLVGYGVIRFLIEYVREPDPGLPLFFEIFTHGQFFSLFVIATGVFIFIWFQVEKCGKMGE